MTRLRTVKANALSALLHEPVDDEALRVARDILEAVKNGGDRALLEHAIRFGDMSEGEDRLVVPRDELNAARNALPKEQRDLLERTAERILRFAECQKASLHETSFELPGGSAKQCIAPVSSAGCYAPGGRFPLPSSVLMTAVTARAAGVETVWVASPRPAPITLAAAAVAEADALLPVGGAHAIAALAFGTKSVPRCDMVVGPGNRFVTAAKQLAYGRTGIDMLAGPSELLVLADKGADPELIAADLLAQAEHDESAIPMLVTTEESLPRAVNEALESQLATLDTKETAARALENGWAIVARSLDEAIATCNRLAPEHLEVMVDDAETILPELIHFGGLFVGAGSAEVLGDYGAGPNHVLPTGRSARFTGGLSVLSFLRVRTVLSIRDPAAADALLRDARDLAKLEGLTGHARSAERRFKQ